MAVSYKRGIPVQIWAQTDGKVDVFIAGVGTGGTITGTSKFLKTKNSKMLTIAVSPNLLTLVTSSLLLYSRHRSSKVLEP